MSATQQLSFNAIPYVGFSTSGGSSALNVCLQLLFHTKDFVDSLSEIQDHQCPGDLCLWCRLIEVLVDIKTCTSGVVNVDEDFHSNFFGGLNGDTYSYILKVLCQLSHEFKGLSNYNYDTAPFIQTFDVGLKCHQTCLGCGLENVFTATKISIDVPVANEDTVTVATLKLLLHNKTDLLWCDKCSSCTDHMVIKTLEKNPKMLCIRLLRFQETGIRDRTPIKLSESIILPSGTKYHLMGTALHLGDTLYTGQSMMLLKCTNGSFRLISDSQVKNVSHESVFASDVIRQASYLIIYERNTSESLQDPNTSHVSLDMSAVVEQVSPSVSTHRSWIVSPITDREALSSPEHVFGSVKRVLTFPHTAITTKVLTPISEEDRGSHKSTDSPHLHRKENNQFTNESFLIDHRDLNRSITSYMSNISPIPPQITSAKRRQRLKPRALNMEINTSDDILNESANLLNKSGPIIHNLSGSFTVTLTGTTTTPPPPPLKTKKPVKRLRSRRLGMRPTGIPTRVIVCYETCSSTLSGKKFKFFTISMCFLI